MERQGWLTRAARRSCAWAERWFPDAWVFAALAVVLVAAAEQYGLPIHAIGVGEKIDDLRPFDPALVARVIAGDVA